MTPPPQGSEPGHSEESCRVLVLQNGARHNYAVPLALAREGILAGFYTDACGNVGIGRLSRLMEWLPSIGAACGRLAKRRVPDEVRRFTRSFSLSSLSETLDPAQKIPQPDRWYASAMEKAGRCGANIVYSSLGWAPSFLNKSRSLGIPIIIECYIRPSIWRVSLSEHTRFPGWEDTAPFPDLTNNEAGRRKPFVNCDHVIVPGQSVKLDIVNEELFPEERIHVVPYGIAESFFETRNRPIPGRILYVGAVSLVKGIRYLAEASHLVEFLAPTLETHFVVAGDVTSNVRNKQECSRLEFLGRVPRTEIVSLYEQADVLVFPTLSDSFGAVVLEAMAAGIPVICSPYCTDAVQNGVSGFVVEPRNTEALANSIIQIVGDRNLRERMSQAARERARQFTWEKHQSKLAKTLSSILTNNKGYAPLSDDIMSAQHSLIN